eukprot:TRINITY_DN3288_c0_g1_i1.p1 TRINITY_DN3288_c0_g1~~TRINITY_DN3288_c0_g1_i1.p1  ORF type:complete len:761 (+),score=196.93 TRINITY_DN3288_c0_g1_i1:60-2285(+)
MTVCSVCRTVVRGRMDRHDCEQVLYDAQQKLLKAQGPPPRAMGAARARGDVEAWTVPSELVMAAPGTGRLEWYLGGVWMGLITRLELTPRGSRAFVMSGEGSRAGGWVSGVLPSSVATSLETEAEEYVLFENLAVLAEVAGILHRLRRQGNASPCTSPAHSLRSRGSVNTSYRPQQHSPGPSPRGGDGESSPANNYARYVTYFPECPVLDVFEPPEGVPAVGSGDATNSGPSSPTNGMREEASESALGRRGPAQRKKSGLSVWVGKMFGEKKEKEKDRPRGSMPDLRPPQSPSNSARSPRAATASTRRRSLQSGPQNVILGWTTEDGTTSPAHRNSAAQQTMNFPFEAPPAERIQSARDNGDLISFDTTIEVALCRHGRLERFLNDEWQGAASGVTVENNPNRYLFRAWVADAMGNPEHEVVDNDPAQNRAKYTLVFPAPEGGNDQLRHIHHMATKSGVATDLQRFDQQQRRQTVPVEDTVEEMPVQTPNVVELLDDTTFTAESKLWPLPSGPPTEQAEAPPPAAMASSSEAPPVDPAPIAPEDPVPPSPPRDDGPSAPVPQPPALSPQLSHESVEAAMEAAFPDTEVLSDGTADTGMPRLGSAESRHSERLGLPPRHSPAVSPPDEPLEAPAASGSSGPAEQVTSPQLQVPTGGEPVAAEQTPPMQMPSLMVPMAPAAAQPAAPPEEEEIQNPCCICLEAPRNCVFFPCRHLCACKDCSQKVMYCPMCRVKVAHRVEIWL